MDILSVLIVTHITILRVSFPSPVPPLQFSQSAPNVSQNDNLFPRIDTTDAQSPKKKRAIPMRYETYVIK